MRALTVCAIFAELIVRGEKSIENRPRPTAYRGPLLVHAGLRRAWGGMTCVAWAERFGVDPASLAPGHALGVVDVVDCVPLDELVRHHPSLAGGPHAIGPWCWIFADARRLPAPIPMRGQLGLFHPPKVAASRARACASLRPRPVNTGGIAC